MTLAEKYRPETLENLIGQSKIKPILSNLIKEPKSVIFYGKAGCGKTTAARIIANQSGMNYYSLNAITASTTEIKKLQKPCLLFLDEIQYFNKKQQQTLLPYMESGSITLIGATTENPWHTLNQTLLSRASVVKFSQISSTDISNKIREVCQAEGIFITEEAIVELGKRSKGDIRLAYTTLEFASIQFKEITKDVIEESLPETITIMEDDLHQLKSALQKSIRGSDPNAAVFYLAKLLEGGALEDVCRRLMICSAEDIGCAYPLALSITYSAVQMAKEVGMPEAKFPLASLVIFLANCPKSFSAGEAYLKAREKALRGYGEEVPSYLNRDNAYGYLNPHKYPKQWCKQEYMPKDLKGEIFYQPADNKFEKSSFEYWLKIKSSEK